MNRVVGDIPIEPFPDAPATLQPDEDRPRVLLVDDDERNLLAIANVLDDLGEIVSARSGEEALRHLLKGEFAVILLDVYMPGMDGYETAQIIRSRDQSKGIPIVFLSAVNKEAEHLLRGYSMGAVDYVFKPVDPIVLRSKVTVFVDLFAKTKEIERKAAVQKSLLEANLKANAERLSAERELRFAEQRQAAILQALPIVLYVEHPNEALRVPQYVAGNFQALTGFTVEEVAANPNIFLERLHPDDHDKVKRALAERAATGMMSVEYRWRHADGTYRDFLDQTVQLPDEGNGKRLAGSFLDVSDRKSLEIQLIQAQKMDAIGKLTGGIAHDFNNLLAAVIGGVGLIEKRAALQDEERKILGMTKRAAEQGSELVRRLLAFARRQKLEPHPVPTGTLRETVSDLLAHTLGGLVEIEWRTEADAWDAFADQAQLELAIVNLIINARDAMPAGGTVTVSIANRAADTERPSNLPAGDHVLIAITDTGTGIAPDDLERVMDPFFTTKELGKGSGLGLSMVYGFAQQSNGAFRIESELGRGTRAELWLPRAPDDHPAGSRPQAECGEIASPGPLKILLVDDHEEVRATTGAMLEEFGHMVTGAANGRDALQALHDGDCEYDLMISDYAMPHVSGTEFLREARVICPGVPALIITGYAEVDAIGDRPENVEVLLKPFTPKALEAAIARICAPAAVAG